MDLALPVDIRAEIFRNVLQDSRFKAWKDFHRQWQLHISAGPGSGKTTLSTLIARHLSDGSTALVVLIHINDDEQLGYEKATVENKQCGSSLNHSPDGVEGFRQSSMARTISISSCSTNWVHIFTGVTGRLANTDQMYLIVDGYDRLEKSVRKQTMQQSQLLQAQGLKILLLRAVPELQTLTNQDRYCDSCDSEGDSEGGLQIYWNCGICSYDVCDTCKAQGEHCADAEHQMNEPYSFIDIILKPIPSELKAFVLRDLETEYGKVISDDIVEAICQQNEGTGNVNLAKLRLDQIRDLESLQDILAVQDRLPREIVAFFDWEIRCIKDGESSQRSQTLLALVAASEARSISVDELERILTGTNNNSPAQVDGNYPYVQQALQSARGLLCIIYEYGKPDEEELTSGRHTIIVYLDDLKWYIRDNYNQDLVSAKQRLHQLRSRADSPDEVILANTRGAMSSGTDTTDASNLGEHTKVNIITGVRQERNILDAIHKKPGTVCPTCQEELFRGNANSGLRTWPICNPETKCPICIYACNIVEARKICSPAISKNNEAIYLHWSRRTMGRTSNALDHLALTLRSERSFNGASCKKFIFVSKFWLGFVPNELDLGNSTRLENTGSRIRQWLQTCQTEHVDCAYQRNDTYVPKRLVDVHTGTVGVYRIVNTAAHDIKGPYVTLSHSWGRDPKFLMLTTKEQQRLMTKGFSISEIGNENFKEAIEVAQYLEVRYIWIDSLCICQEGEDGDFETEGQYMHKVYQNSFCNIVAADSKDSTGGLFRAREPRSVFDLDDVSDTDDNCTAREWIMLDKDLWSEHLLQSPIYTRGWVFQERMLSPRIIHFTNSQVFWDCSTISACETLPDGLPFALSAHATTDRRWRGRLQRTNSGQKMTSITAEDSLESFWKRAVLNYTSCELTKQSDKMFAIWSVAKLVRDHLHHLMDEYGGGLWKNALHEQLAWQAKVMKQEARMDILQLKFPSWSWASVNAPIQVQDRLVERRCYTIKNHQEAAIGFEDFKNKAIDKDLQPEFETSDSLAIRGYLVPGQLRHDPIDELYHFQAEFQINARSFHVALDEIPTTALLDHTECYFLPLAARKCDEEGRIYAGTGLFLVSTEDCRRNIREKLKKHITELKSLNLTKTQGRQSIKTRDVELCRLRTCVEVLQAWLDKVSKRERDIRPLGTPCYRRIGAAQFHSLAAETWARIRMYEEKNFWLD